MKPKAIYQPHAGHFCGSNKCRFRLNTWVGPLTGFKEGVIVSTIGDYYLSDILIELNGTEKSYYETMVFNATLNEDTCCGSKYVITGNELLVKSYDDCAIATKAHKTLVAKILKEQRIP